MTAQVLFFNDFSKKTQHLNAVEYIKVINIVGIHTYIYIYIYICTYSYIYGYNIYGHIIYTYIYVYTYIHTYINVEIFYCVMM